MISSHPRTKRFKIFFVVAVLLLSIFVKAPLRIFADDILDQPTMISVEESRTSLSERISRKITLDVRDMNIIDVIKFLAIQGDFNVVTSKSVAGRVTLYLKSVAIQDALDIILISNNLAYELKNEIVYVMSETEYQAVHGKSFNDRRIVRTIRLQYAKPDYVLATLESVKSSLGKIVIDEDTGTVVMIDTSAAIEKMLSALREVEMPMKTYVYNLQYAKAQAVVTQLNERLEQSAVGSIVADERTNQIIIRALPDRRKEILDVVKSLDKPTKGVLIEAHILQIVYKPEFGFGIDWDFSENIDREISRLSFQNIFLGEKGGDPIGELSSRYARMAIGNIEATRFFAALRAMKQISDTRILSSPKLLVANNEEASIHIGDRVPYVITTRTVVAGDTVDAEDVKFIDVGLKLHVTASINDEGFVNMDIMPEISSVVGYLETTSGNLIPRVNTTYVKTNAIVKDGTTIIMGGLKNEDKKIGRRGVPFLMDLPWIGGLFSTISEQSALTELVILITPHITLGDEHYEDRKGTIKPYKTYGP